MSIQLPETFKNATDIDTHDAMFDRYNPALLQAKQFAELDAFNNEELGKQGLGSLVKSGAAEAITSARDALIEQEEKNKQNTAEVLMLLASMREIDAQIAVYEEEIKELEEDIDALEVEIEELEDIKEKISDPNFDPDDPKNSDIMAKAREHGITEQDIRDGTAGDKIDAKIADKKTAIDSNRDTIADRRSTIEGLQKDRKALVEARVEAIKARDPDADVEELEAEFDQESALDVEVLTQGERSSGVVLEAARASVTNGFAVDGAEDDFDPFTDKYDPFADTLEGDSDTFRLSTDLDNPSDEPEIEQMPEHPQTTIAQEMTMKI